MFTSISRKWLMRYLLVIAAICLGLYTFNTSNNKDDILLYASLASSDGWNSASITFLRDNSFIYNTSGQTEKGLFLLMNDTIVFNQSLFKGEKAILQYVNHPKNDTLLRFIDDEGKLKENNIYNVHENKMTLLIMRGE